MSDQTGAAQPFGVVAGRPETGVPVITRGCGECGGRDGQLADGGVLQLAGGAVVRIHDVQKPISGLIVHRATVVAGEVHADESAHAEVDIERRRSISRAHTATHMVHKAIREALGDTATQAGSENAPGRFRFDFTATSAVPVTVLRDYHVENLMLVGPERTLGLLDFQDALAGHPAYDLVSLLQDARRDVEPSIEEAMLKRYLAATGEGDAFLNAYHVLGAQRNAKIIGIFTRLWKRDGKPRYAALCPRVWAYLERDLSQPVLAPVAAWFDDNVPPELRGDPKVLSA